MCYVIVIISCCMLWITLWILWISKSKTLDIISNVFLLYSLCISIPLYPLCTSCYMCISNKVYISSYNLLYTSTIHSISLYNSKGYVMMILKDIVNVVSLYMGVYSFLPLYLLYILGIFSISFNISLCYISL